MTNINSLPPSDAVRKHEKNNKKLAGIFSAVLLELKKYHPSGNLKFNYLGILQSSKLRLLS